MQAEEFQNRILSWFDRNGRKDLPWQQDINAYKVWISEIMLQQTQVVTVIPYFNRFISRFPDVASLAEARLDEVLAYWSGLGYYARARNLHKTAQIIRQQELFPESLAELVALPGIGRSTAGAVLSIAFKQSQPILDGNVKRVLTRFFAIAGWTGDAKVEQELWLLSTRYTPKNRTADYTQAMMDLGATLCVRSKPNCLICPLNTQCQAFKTGTVTVYPTSKPRQPLPVKQTCLLMLVNGQGELYLHKRAESGIWGGLWSFPEFENGELALQWCAQQGLHIQNQTILAVRRHTFSHYHLDYATLCLRLTNKPMQVMGHGNAGWYNKNQLEQVGLPTPVKRLVQQYLEENLYV